ncbi:MAG: hypothetical protein KC416_10010 [Myxococcales bacterium]|nr:hypothetical protein [Myxococcales bacterium]
MAVELRWVIRGGDMSSSPPFAALILAAESDPGAARGLALAYEGLSTSDRGRLIEAVVVDARREGISPGSALAVLLGVEENPSLAQHLFDTMAEDGGRGLPPRVRSQGYVCGTDGEGAAVVASSLFGDFLEVAALRWSDSQGITRAVIDPMVRADEVPGRVAALDMEAPFEETTSDAAMDRMVEALWHHRKMHGGMPPGVERIATLIR